MTDFKIGDRVKYVGTSYAESEDLSANAAGTVCRIDSYSWPIGVAFDNTRNYADPETYFPCAAEELELIDD